MPQGDKQTHESYGMAGFFRSSGGHTNLFGSSISHNHTIRFRIKTASKERGLNTDWYYGDKELIEIEMSQNQFAELITSMNMGDGVPVTIRRVNGKSMENCPEENKRQLFEKEFDQKMKELRNKLSKLTSDAKQILNEKKSLTKADRETILNQISMLEQEIGSNTPFVLSMFNEQMDKTVTEAKGEVEAFVQNKITSLGIEGLKAETLMLQEGREE
jgi:hypothetical protein